MHSVKYLEGPTYRVETPSGQGYYIDAFSEEEALAKFKKLTDSPAVKVSRWL